MRGDEVVIQGEVLAEMRVMEGDAEVKDNGVSDLGKDDMVKKEVVENNRLLKGEEMKHGDAEVTMGYGVPEIDLSRVFSGDGENRRAVAKAMVEAWRTWGAFLVVNHGVDQSVVEGAREQGMRVFALPMDNKLQAWREEGKFAGYGNGAGSKTTHSDDIGSESFRVAYPGADITNFAQKLWPGNCETFCEDYEAYIAASQKLTVQLVELLSEGLSEEDGSHINSYFREPCVGSVRLNYYPASATIGLPAHTDVAAFVLLHQCDGGEGLQVEKNGQWVTVQARSDAFVVIMGTVYQILTNGEYKAGRHRAIKGGNKDRLSMVFSLWPNPSLPMSPAPSFLAAHKQRLLYKPLTFPEFWDAREADLLNPLKCIAVDAD
ncbi:hypothetical protein M758_9G063500 [Ceratodon purpureus]|nr:hypothetical protein M758_9G063500 [Ceratodon purpureus]